MPPMVLERAGTTRGRLTRRVGGAHDTRRENGDEETWGAFGTADWDNEESNKAEGGGVGSGDGIGDGRLEKKGED